MYFCQIKQIMAHIHHQLEQRPTDHSASGQQHQTPPTKNMPQSIMGNKRFYNTTRACQKIEGTMIQGNHVIQNKWNVDGNIAELSPNIIEIKLVENIASQDSEGPSLAWKTPSPSQPTSLF